ncbi:urease accessory protein UreF [Saccharospirillum salsuginis]|nr:urease accessory protein UreF [Saccharospirillum salsuginis]
MATITTDTMAESARPPQSGSALLRLLQLSSVSLPVGGFSFSQGLEYAVEAGWVHNVETTRRFLSEQLRYNLSRVDLPILARSHAATLAGDAEQLQDCNNLILACRETRELRFTDTAMGRALVRLLRSLEMAPPLAADEDISFVTAFAYAAACWSIPIDDTALGFAWAWLENQVAAATKLVPLGQTQAQQLLGELNPVLTDAWTLARGIDVDDIGACLPALAIASCRHETQYTRLFRS